MKATLKIMAACLLLLAACQNPSKKKQDFIPGTYVQHSKGEYGVADDTLIIQHADGSSYQITQRTTYQAIREGKLLPKKHRVQNLDASWDDTKQELDETTTGRVYHVDLDKNALIIKQSSYLKIR
ncbi:hypothetical protein SAMN05421821_10282 [Mucilaginibacter lappiensis]|uniref:Major membrane immunogen (Membrane-anchored lipoprotein) n=1 Tax=Mucilaginibacter lappiensis TaxID=354630 RepID=A0ABR6PFZ0_9SPHI|nr:hypothetical protein [Mucilaginibacter lappiensis]MBB6108683.1 major membrane immunogen (membrane-anchored lipoprotein) [Mucilaginibacter lappiensis]SIQ27929.1 hypothetical protein SAMN05421821_10282 [Mucilaginibacter lappiensis]